MNPIEYYSDEEFKKRFRFTKKAIAEYILPRVSAHLTKDTARGLPVSPLYDILVALRFYATSSMRVM